MTDTAAPAFTHGSTFKHVVVMTSTGSVGLMAIFAVDFLNLFYISLLGEVELAAAIGYAGTVLFFATAVSIGVTIAGTALVSRALGSRDRDAARRLGGSFLVYSLAITVAATAIAQPLLGDVLSLLGATGRTHAVAERFLWMVMPSTPLLALGMAGSGILRAVGDPHRAMWVTLGGGLVTAVFDPVFIFAFGLGVDGAAIVSILSRLVLAGLALHGAIRVHDLLGRPSLAELRADSRALSVIAVPAVLTNVATPVGNVFVTASLADFGDAAVAAWAVIGRIIPLAFAPVFALTGAIGPILGQNVGARLFERVRRALADSLMLVTVYVLVIWVVLALLRWPVAHMFGLSEPAAALAAFYALWLTGLFVFNGALFVANAAFNNLGFPVLSMVFNWGRATLGTVPFVWAGAAWGAEGVLAGQALGGVVFGVVGVIVAFKVVARLGRGDGESGAPPLASPPLTPFTSGEDAAVTPSP
ncbi:MATE family efflux transporter [Blastochloris viridis]|uniref:Multidrug and toxin extrusion family efflux pump YdhE/NorM n=1 Tax=Blastochloris viridis TaxID=1079 RepID=A0A0H5BAB2_BLAVI|nr:MATE family efflux transporter [Blastochloris viridis]ALK10828.1 Multidrug export protein MepA [Blastochloris viridis]BAR99197.1 multidrug and toxin extrusion family efflux pump YdhE/NorM [Blastochloris viridis]CUU43490.1 Multidrug export protein mepA [Blastochloris viridis]